MFIVVVVVVTALGTSSFMLLDASPSPFSKNISSVTVKKTINHNKSMKMEEYSMLLVSNGAVRRAAAASMSHQ